jgi:hypothetical protein
LLAGLTAHLGAEAGRYRLRRLEAEPAAGALALARRLVIEETGSDNQKEET